MRAQFYTARPQPSLLQPFVEPAFIGGMDDNVPLQNGPAGAAIFLYNMIPIGPGVTTREGWAVWATNVGGLGGAEEVRSVISFAGQTQDGTQARLFAATRLGIYDVTSRGADNPTPVVTFADTGSDAGFITSLHFVDPSGAQTLFVADARNGLYEYDPAGPTWTKYTATELQGVDPAKVAFIMTHKGRMWFIERDASDAWYLPTGQKQGLAVKFQFGAKFRAGGELVGVYPWTHDGGRGVEDHLIAVSRSGDVLAYSGYDPSDAATWFLTGSWLIGEIPAGRRIGIESGGDLILLSVYGAVGMSVLTSGFEPSRIERNVTGKISTIIGDETRKKIQQPYWQLKLVPEEEVVVINTPTDPDERPIQFVLNVSRGTEGSGGGWGMWRDVPALSFEGHLGNAYFGTANGQVCIMIGSLDDVAVDDTGGKPIEFSVLGRFRDFGHPMRYKQVTWVRPAFVTNNQIEYQAKPVYDFNIQELVQGGAVFPFFGSRWDIDRWDEAIWTGLTSLSPTAGTGGYGRNVAMAARGEVITRTTLLGFEGAWQAWDIL